ncbi:Haloacid dehalogenase-like hydrolase (HAD) superfamily protein [Abeliophyllum distichum]|uniref:Haloacid dehalogenase-like hydrolase (HAD) superfamily protein n=1 Tax=Abeliophyllum distichum TaxID=126358 RepID=A0ABD1NSW2_9LAMI
MTGRSFSSMPSELKPFQSINGIQQLAETRRFKAWFLDQFGVLHDGKLPYPGAISTLEQLLATYGTKMVIISNSSRRASTTIEKLRSLGFDTSLFVGAITSGELTHEHLLREMIHGLQDYEALGLPSGAALPMKLENLEKILEQCVAKKIPMVVANPDFVTVEARALCVMPDDKLIQLFKLRFEELEEEYKRQNRAKIAGDEFWEEDTIEDRRSRHGIEDSSARITGTPAATYEKLGGELKWMGKPGEILYKSAMVMVGVDAADCIAVGDSLHHDIEGANVAGISSAFITGGVHATELGLGKFGETADDSSVQALALKYEAYPTYVLPSFTW